MEYYGFIGFLAILRESIKILPRNGKLMIFVFAISILLASLTDLAFLFAAKALINDMIVKQNSFAVATRNGPQSSSQVLAAITEDRKLLLGFECVFLLASFVVSLISTIAIILVLAASYLGKKLSNKDFLIKLAKTWKRPFITWFCITLLIIGYAFAVLILMIPIFVFSDQFVVRKALLIVLAFLASGFFLYLSVVWVLAFVISVIEENFCGFEALRKASKLVKGKKLHGFILNLLFTLLSVILSLASRFTGFQQMLVTFFLTKQQQAVVYVTFSLVTFIIFNYLLNVLQLTAYTVLYFQCKKIHGEEIETQESFEYSKIPSTPLPSEDV